MALEKIGFEKKYPDWQVRKYRRLIKLFIVPQFNEMINDYKTHPEWPVSLLAYTVVLGSKLPLGCFNAVESFIKYKKPFQGQELMNLIEPEPIRFYNVDTKKYTPSLRGTKGIFYKEMLKDRVLISIPPNTSREEINTFLDKHFAKEIQPIVGTIGKVSKLSSDELAVAVMKMQGKSYKEINDNLPSTHTEEDLRKMYSRFTKRKM